MAGTTTIAVIALAIGDPAGIITAHKSLHMIFTGIKLDHGRP
jgi:hypothetical protein